MKIYLIKEKKTGKYVTTSLFSLEEALFTLGEIELNNKRLNSYQENAYEIVEQRTIDSFNKITLNITCGEEVARMVRDALVMYSETEHDNGGWKVLDVLKSVNEQLQEKGIGDMFNLRSERCVVFSFSHKEALEHALKLKKKSSKNNVDFVYYNDITKQLFKIKKGGKKWDGIYTLVNSVDKISF